MFLDEARLAARLNHPNVVQTNEVGGDGRRYFICMEYLEGQPLNRIIDAASAPTRGLDARACRCASSSTRSRASTTRTSSATSTATPLQVVHRDATPHNIFVTYAGQVKVVDFGIAKALSSSHRDRAPACSRARSRTWPPSRPWARRSTAAPTSSRWGSSCGRCSPASGLFKGMPDVAVLQKIVNGAVPAPTTVRPRRPRRAGRDLHEGARPPARGSLRHRGRHGRRAGEAGRRPGREGQRRATPARLIDQFFAGERARNQAARRGAHRAVARDRPRALRHARPQLEPPRPKLPVLDTAHGRSRRPASATPPSRARARCATGPSAQQTVQPSSLTAGRRLPADRRACHAQAGRGRSSRPSPPEPSARRRRWPSSRTGAPRRPRRPPPATATPRPRPRRTPCSSTPRRRAPPCARATRSSARRPMTLEHRPGRRRPRRLVMALDGYAPYTFLPTREDTRIIVPLPARAPVTRRPPRAPEKARRRRQAGAAGPCAAAAARLPRRPPSRRGPPTSTRPVSSSALEPRSASDPATASLPDRKRPP